MLSRGWWCLNRCTSGSLSSWYSKIKAHLLHYATADLFGTLSAVEPGMLYRPVSKTVSFRCCDMTAWLHGIWFCQRLFQTHAKEKNHTKDFEIHQKSTHTLFCVCAGAMINQANSMGLVSDNASWMKQPKSYIYCAQSGSLMAGKYSGGFAE